MVTPKKNQLTAPSSQSKIKASPIDKNSDEDSNMSSSTTTIQESPPDYNDPDYINRRLAEMSTAIDNKKSK